MSAPILQIEDAHVDFHAPGGVVRALDGVTLDVNPAETMAIVGESGCGKTTLARTVLGLQPLASGSVSMLGQTVEGIRRDQAARVGMVWQDPGASLDPRWRVGRSAMESITLLGRRGDAKAAFREVGLDESFVDRFPHQLSGGQRQRVAIARAIAPRPPLVICDEPTAALDLSVRAQILNLLREIQSKVNCSFLYISHDLHTVRYLADRVAVMYLGRIVESGPADVVFAHPKHPYTKALLDSAPTLDRLTELPPMPKGEVPDPRTRFPGCRYAARCDFAQPICAEQDPAGALVEGRTVFCHFPIGTESAPEDAK